MVVQVPFFLEVCCDLRAAGYSLLLVIAILSPSVAAGFVAHAGGWRGFAICDVDRCPALLGSTGVGE